MSCLINKFNCACNSGNLIMMNYMLEKYRVTFFLGKKKLLFRIYFLEEIFYYKNT